MWTPYFCIIWPCPYSEIQWYISHNRLKRLDFSFGQSVFSFLMVNSKGGCSSILLQELPMRCSAINLVDSSDSPWGRLHGHIQTSCTFDSSHSRADTKWRLSVSYILSAECEGSVTQSRTASNSLGAPEDTQTSF